MIRRAQGSQQIARLSPTPNKDGLLTPLVHVSGRAPQPHALQSSSQPFSGGSAFKTEIPELEISKWKKELRLALMQHEADTQQLIQSSLLSGILPIPDSNLERIRIKNLPRLSRAAEALKRCRVFNNMTESELRSLLSTSEKRVMEAVTNTSQSVSFRKGQVSWQTKDRTRHS